MFVMFDFSQYRFLPEIKISFHTVCESVLRTSHGWWRRLRLPHRCGAQRGALLADLVDGLVGPRFVGTEKAVVVSDSRQLVEMVVAVCP